MVHFHSFPEAGEEPLGYVHSRFAGSAVDGPGMRYLLFMAGCNYRCLYCHNPDTWKLRCGTPMGIAEVMAGIGRYAAFLRRAGGLTVSGGEPLLQAAFVGEVFRRAKRDLGLHTALDTQGSLGGTLADAWFEDVDLVLLDIKHGDPGKYRALTSQPQEPNLDFARRLADMGKPVWLRYVVVPGHTDGYEDVERLGEFVSTLGNVTRVELLPYHGMGAVKWRELGLAYRLEGVQAPSAELLERIAAQLRRRGLPLPAAG